MSEHSVVEQMLDEHIRGGNYSSPRRSGPTIVCLCGSTRFYEAFQEANYRETLQGKIVLSVGFYPHAQREMHARDVGCTPEQKKALDELHLRKIDLADEVLVLNVGGYIGESTRREIAYTVSVGKTQGLRFLHEKAGDEYLQNHAHEMAQLVAEFMSARG